MQTVPKAWRAPLGAAALAACFALADSAQAQGKLTANQLQQRCNTKQPNQLRADQCVGVAEAERKKWENKAAEIDYRIDRLREEIRSYDNLRYAGDFGATYELMTTQLRHELAENISFRISVEGTLQAIRSQSIKATLNPTTDTPRGDTDAVHTHVSFAFDVGRWLGFDPRSSALYVIPHLGYSAARTRFEPTAALAAAGFGNIGSQTSSVFEYGGTIAYRHEYWFAGASFSGSTGWVRSTNEILGGNGSYATHGFGAGGALGRVFVLYRAARAPGTETGMFDLDRLFLTASGEIGYFRERGEAHTVAGFLFGEQIRRYWSAGGTLRLDAQMAPYRGIFAAPFVSFGVSHRFGYRDTFDLPAQGPVFSGARISYDPAKTVYRFDGGVSFRANAWLEFVIGGYYSFKHDTSSAGGTIRGQLRF